MTDPKVVELVTEFDRSESEYAAYDDIRLLNAEDCYLVIRTLDNKLKGINLKEFVNGRYANIARTLIQTLELNPTLDLALDEQGNVTKVYRAPEGVENVTMIYLT